MHIKEKKFNKVIAMFMCILLLSNFGISVVYATRNDSGPIEAGIYVSNNGQSSVEYSNHTLTAVYSSLPRTSYLERAIINEIQVTASGAYTINLATPNGPAKYMICTADTHQHVRLAAEYKNGEHYLLTGGPSKTSSQVDVFLEAGKTYYIALAGYNQPLTIADKSGGYPVTLSIKKRVDLPRYGVFATNISAAVVSEGANNPNSSVLERFNDHSIKLYEFSQKEIEEYVIYGKKEEMSNGGELQGILVDLIIGIGTIFTAVVEKLVGANDKLTIDNFIFNKLDQTVIDLTPLGGIQIGGTGQGIFYQSEIGQVIKVLFNALKNLAIAIYIVMFLVIGVKILVSVGTPDQSKYFKYVEYWITGLILLAIVPYFIPAIPTMTNAVVEMMADKAKQISGSYDTQEIVARLGDNASYLGEDAEIVEIEKLIDERIHQLSGMMSGDAMSVEEAQAQIDSKIVEAINRFSDLTEEEKNALKSKIDIVKNYINENYDSWDTVKEEVYQGYLEDVREEMLSNSNVDSVVRNIMSGLPNDIKTDSDVSSQITRIMKMIQRNAAVWDSRAVNEYQRNVDVLMTLLEAKGLTQYEDECARAVEETKNEYLQYARSPASRNLEELFADYKNAVIGEEIADLQQIKTELARDIMTRLKQNAQKQNRIVYAIAWAILLYQMFAVMFLYYKRLFAIIVLIIIFPLVMSFYVIDKIGDGESQSLKKWFNELLANCLVQVLHAAIYIILINIGIEACEADPEKNWFILVLTVCFLFPGEKIIRGIVGLRASTLDELKNNFTGLLIGTHAVTSVAKNSYRAGRQFVKDGGPKGVKEKWQKEIEKQKEEEDKKKQNKQKIQASRARSREYREERLRDGEGSILDKALNKVDEAKDRINATAIVSGTKQVVSKVKDSGVVQQGAKIAKATTRYGKFALKKTGSFARKGVGLTMGAMEGMENFEHGGAMSAFATARGVAHSIGGFKDYKKPKKEVKQPELTEKEAKIKENANKFTTKYENGVKVSGNSKTTPGNERGTASNNNTNKMANKIKSKININVNTSND